MFTFWQYDFPGFARPGGAAGVQNGADLYSLCAQKTPLTRGRQNGHGLWGHGTILLNVSCSTDLASEPVREKDEKQ